eukprot:6065609-Alexandrium_andersonii.AAC.1
MCIRDRLRTCLHLRIRRGLRPRLAFDPAAGSRRAACASSPDPAAGETACPQSSGAWAGASSTWTSPTTAMAQARAICPPARRG